MTANDEARPALITRLLVPLDGSALAERILPAAASVATKLGASLTLLHVLERDAPTSIHGEQHLAESRAAEAYLTRLVDGLRADGLDANYHVHPNPERDVAQSIVSHAAELTNDLVVMSTHGRGGMRDVVAGTIAEQVVRKGSTPVLLLRPGTEPAVGLDLHRVMAPLDGSHDAELALAYADVLARAWGAQLLLVRVVPYRGDLAGDQAALASMLPSATEAALEIEREDAVAYLGELAASRQRAGLDAQVAVLRGDPTSTLLDCADKRGADLVVVVTHGRVGLHAFWTASVGHRLAERLTKPVLLLKAAG
jgi:nucleotide-binding universal stress UspA family protein